MLVIGPRVKEWVEEVQKAKFASNAHAIGWGSLHRGIICGVVYEGYNGANYWVHIAKMKGTKFPAAFIAAFVDYPFNQLGCRRISATIAESNSQAINFARKLGAAQEGRLPEATSNGEALLIFGLLRKDAAKWLSTSYQRHLGEFYGIVSRRVCRGYARQAASSASA